MKRITTSATSRRKAAAVPATPVASPALPTQRVPSIPIPLATAVQPGLMSPQDYVKLANMDLLIGTGPRPAVDQVARNTMYIRVGGTPLVAVGIWVTYAGAWASLSIGGSAPSNPDDVTAPEITAFTIPATSSSLAITISTFTATDAIGVTGYLVTESATAPSSGDPDWSSTPPTQYVCATEGAKTLYAWARDAAGNVSVSANASVTITLPAVYFTATPSRSVGTSTTLNSVALAGVNTTWSGGSTFTASSGSITATTINSATSVSLVYSAPVGAGTITITHVQTGTTATFSVASSSMTATPSASVHVDDTGVTVALAGTNTNWLVMSPTFAVSGGTITAQSITNATTASITFTAPSSVSTITVSGGGQSTTFSVLAPDYSIVSLEMGRANQWNGFPLTTPDCVVIPGPAGAGVLIMARVRAIDPGAAPWTRPNVYPFVVETDNSWQVECSTINGTATGSTASYQTNTMWRCWDGAAMMYAADYTSDTVLDLPLATVNGDVDQAWQIVVSGTDVIMRQWTRFSDGTIHKATSTVTIAQLRAAAVAAGSLTSGQAAAWTPAQAISRVVCGVSPCYMTGVKVFAQTAEPTNTTIAELFDTKYPSPDAHYDGAFSWVNGAPVLVDRSGTGTTPTRNGTLYAGPVSTLERPVGVAPVVTDWEGMDLQLTSLGSSAQAERTRGTPDQPTYDANMPGARSFEHIALAAGCPDSRLHQYAAGGSHLHDYAGLENQIINAAAAGHLNARTIAFMDLGSLINQAAHYGLNNASGGSSANLADPTMCAAFILEWAALLDACLATGARVIILEPPSAVSAFVQDGGIELRNQLGIYLASRTPAWNVSTHESPVWSLTARTPTVPGNLFTGQDPDCYQDRPTVGFEYPGPHLSTKGGGLISAPASVRINSVAQEIGYLQSFTATPGASVRPSSTGNTITLSGTRTNWTSGTPGSPTFTVSSGTITARTVASATSATLTFTAPAGAATITVTDPSSGATATFSVASASMAASPATFTESSTGNMLTLVGTGTAWVAGSPGTPTFTLSNGSITAQVVASSTSATLTISTTPGTRTVTVTDPSSGATTTYGVTSAGAEIYFQDTFTRADGAVGNGWVPTDGLGATHWGIGDGATAVIANNALRRTDSGGFRLFLNNGGVTLPADYTVSATVPHSLVDSNTAVPRSGPWWGFVGRYTSPGYNNCGGVFFIRDNNQDTFYFNTGVLDNSQTFVVTGGLPPTWHTDQPHTVALRFVGTVCTLILDGVEYGYHTCGNNAAGTYFGVIGDPGGTTLLEVLDITVTANP